MEPSVPVIPCLCSTSAQCILKQTQCQRPSTSAVQPAVLRTGQVHSCGPICTMGTEWTGNSSTIDEAENSGQAKHGEATMSLVKMVYNSRLARRVYRTPLGRFIFHLPGEIVGRLTGKRSGLTPPMWKVYTGRGDFEGVGREFLTHFRDLGGLEPDHRVLDVGSGMGRMAIPLAGYLSSKGSYAGIEIVREGVKWCNKHVCPLHPNFTFIHADIENELYNPKGSCQAHAYRFPFPDGSFDFVFLTSVFTHMHPSAVRNYLHEIARVLSPGGHCLFTCSLLD
ncbi:MAG: methyltransferase domain-containing protein, partial [Chitinivibrionales bacterium]|nr:methyltransferase domain-containing protein [Chitinivibrionales bacterium]